LTDYLKDTDIGLEFGSGRSTLWFSKKVSGLISVEHDRAWYEKVSNRLTENKITNCSYRFCPPEPGSTHEEDKPDSAYVRVAKEITNGTLDFALVDGIYRSACAIAVIEKLRPGGMLIVDNVNWYLPNSSYAPASRSLRDGPVSDAWARFQTAVEGWRRIWTSDGVSDTAFFFKPYG
jgi:predicted O-methyltransferase YrrM